MMQLSTHPQRLQTALGRRKHMDTETSSHLTAKVEDATRVSMPSWGRYNAKVVKADKDDVAPKKDLKLEALVDVLRGKLYVQIHCYRDDEFLTEEAIAKEYGYKIRGFHHALEMYKVGDKIAPTGTGIATFADWWGFKDEAWDAIPWNAVMSMREGVRVALKS